MNKIEINQDGKKPAYHVKLNGQELSHVTSIQFPSGIKSAEYPTILLGIVADVNINLEKADIKVQKNADVSS